jgi:hypothetical protein
MESSRSAMRFKLGFCAMEKIPLVSGIRAPACIELKWARTGRDRCTNRRTKERLTDPGHDRAYCSMAALSTNNRFFLVLAQREPSAAASNCGYADIVRHILPSLD